MKKFISMVMMIFAIASLPDTAIGAEQEVEDLKKRVEELESAVSTIGTSKATEINGYYNFEYKDKNTENVHNSFRMHHFVLFLSKQIDRFRFFSETEFEDAPNFEGNPEDETLPVEGRGSILIERVWLEYINSDAFTLRTGLILVPTYWRVNHYPSLTPSITAPLIDKTVFPPDFVGVMAYGSKFLGSNGLTYEVYTGNGDGPNHGKNDINRSKARGAKLSLHLSKEGLIDYLDIALHGYGDQLRTGQQSIVTGGELLFEKYPFAWASEYAKKTITESDAETSGFYLQPALNIIPKTTLFYRFENFIDQASPEDRDEEIKHLIGVTYKPIPDVVLKLNYGREIFDDESKDDVNSVESAFVFFF